MIPIRVVCLLLLAVGVGGCGPEDRSGNFRAFVYGAVPETGTYGLRQVELKNVESLKELRGQAVEMRRNSDFGPVSEGKPPDFGEAFQLDYSLNADGVVVPADQISLFALSAFHHFETAAAFAASEGFVQKERLRVLFFPRVDNLYFGDMRTMLTDNATYSPMGPCFLLIPSLMLSKTGVPFLVNQGVLAHEFGHAVIDAFQPAPPSGFSDPVFSATHEGVADLIALAVTGDPDSFRHSADLDRNMAEPRDYTTAQFDELRGLCPQREVIPNEQCVTSPKPHDHGSFLARAIYELWPKDQNGKITEQERRRLMRVIFGALATLEPSSFSSFPNQVVALLEPAGKARACEVLRNRLAPLAPELDECQGF